ncbi:Sulfur carrier protein moaD [Serratia entomophila]|jgi:molybdopterin synthase sulfur carrier subunit|uniref:Molybdopterin synthase sulfur carrier subunit n=1 Tax=Serratia entomophila TaxID=42906 RepID=A0ABY5CMI8_9GAMM|nr:molybdopterin synthase sulfur carrier subunit [Serratia entomophila]UIW16733.1 molybdopterin synthase sulfur carrier subunit [Serratia entomophila]USU99290.1 molybdopterin synthase sulfur carrier subunit [Serratia entomophila]CAI0711044.1 Sulfur carrier protein moaD [Serratia entomophila]CAI0711057.1 Sulfur carrier protein moaD [Serratia entomophila]CAI0712137.1 Sulfur carrier protein moaD [Serratia entomophila]
MLDILFFAQVRELVGCSRLQLPAEFATVETLRLALLSRGSRWQLALESDRLLAAVNQTLVPMDHALRAGDEVAFYPPVTGG